MNTVLAKKKHFWNDYIGNNVYLTILGVAIVSAIALGGGMVYATRRDHGKPVISPDMTISAMAYQSDSAVGDMDGDGDLDVIVSSYDGDDTKISFLENTADRFTSRIAVFYAPRDVAHLPSKSYESSVSVGDVNNDGLLDIIVTNYDGNNIAGYVLLNNGDKTFSPSRSEQ